MRIYIKWFRHFASIYICMKRDIEKTFPTTPIKIKRNGSIIRMSNPDWRILLLKWIRSRTKKANGLFQQLGDQMEHGGKKKLLRKDMW